MCSLSYVGFGGILFFAQERFIYQPWPQDFVTCDALQVAEKVTYNGTRMYVREGVKGFVVLYHGNAGSACDRAYYADIFVSHGYGYILPEYAGYSNDVRLPSHDLVRRDVENVTSFLRARSVSEVLVIGESIGTGAASYHTSLLPPDRLLLVSPFTDIESIARELFWYYPTSILVVNAFDNVSLLREYSGSVTVIHGERDTIIPQKLGIRLFEGLPTEQREFVSVSGAGHNDLFAVSTTHELLRRFLEN